MLPRRCRHDCVPAALRRLSPEPEVRIHFPPAQSPLRTCPTRLRRGGFRVAGTITPGKQRAGLSSRRALIGILGSRASPDPALYSAVPRLRRYFARLAKDASERGTATRSQRGRASAE